MSNIVNFESAQLPAFLQGIAGNTSINDDLAALATGFPTISIKGKVFTVVRDGERQVITRPDDPTAAASYISGVIVNHSPKVKTYYAHGYSENAEDNKPTCFSNDGVMPDASVAQPQCSNCRVCPHNAFGTARSDNGGFGKGKACSDSIRLAVATGNDTDVYLLRVPPASLRAIGQYSKQLKSRNIPINAVLTKIYFDINAAAPQLCFQFQGFLTEEQYKRSVEMGQSDQAMRIIGKDDSVAAAPSNQLDNPFGTQAMAAPAPQPVAAPKPAPQPVQVPPAYAPQPAPVAPAPMPQAQAADLGALFDGADVPY